MMADVWHASVEAINTLVQQLLLAELALSAKIFWVNLRFLSCAQWMSLYFKEIQLKTSLKSLFNMFSANTFGAFGKFLSIIWLLGVFSPYYEK